MYNFQTIAVKKEEQEIDYSKHRKQNMKKAIYMDGSQVGGS